MQHFENRMQSTVFSWLINVILALIIYYNAEISGLMGNKNFPLAISVIWTATGFSLAALLLFGYRTWPGIFIGNFSYNFIHLYFSSQTFIGPFISAILITSGSLIEALLGCFILRRFNTTNYFLTVKDIVIFLLPASVLTSLIASTIGIIVIYFYAQPSLETAAYIWIIFWIGDCMGVYIFTPFLVVWSLLQPSIPFRRYFNEMLWMGASFFIITVLAFWFYPIGQLYIPLCLWITYRFRMHGATLAVFLIALITIIPTSLGIGSLIYTPTTDTLLIVVIFLEILVATSLIFAAVLNERDAFKLLLQERHINFQNIFKYATEEIMEIKTEKRIREKITSLGLLTASMARQIQAFLKQAQPLIFECVKASPISDKEKTESALKNISRKVEQAQKLARIIHEQGIIMARSKLIIKIIDLNDLINNCLSKISSQLAQEHPDFIFIIFREFDKKIEFPSLFPDDLALVFTQLFNNAVISMREKKLNLKENYKPILTVRTKDLSEKIKIIIRDNGIGVAENKLSSFFETFIGFEDLEGKELDLVLIHDLIVHVYQGEISVESVEGDYLQISIILPKST